MSNTQSSVIKAQFYFLLFCSGAGEKVKVTAHLHHSNHLCKRVLRNRDEWCDVFMRPRLERKTGGTAVYEHTLHTSQVPPHFKHASEIQKSPLKKKSK